jgi:hypothetical protein
MPSTLSCHDHRIIVNRAVDRRPIDAVVASQGEQHNIYQERI